jgi:hypothetical protein
MLNVGRTTTGVSHEVMTHDKIHRVFHLPGAEVARPVSGLLCWMAMMDDLKL